jgi:hypothetical protein
MVGMGIYRPRRMRAGDGNIRIGAADGKARVDIGPDEVHPQGGQGGQGGGGSGVGGGPISRPVPAARVSLSNGQGIRGCGKPPEKKVAGRGICHQLGSFHCEPGMT